MRTMKHVLLVSGCMLLPRESAHAQTDAAAAAKAAAEKAKTEAQAAAAAAGDFRLRGPNGSIDVVHGQDELTFVYTVYGVNPTLKFQYAPAPNARTVGGFYETANPASSTVTGVAPATVQGLSAGQRSDMIAAATAAAGRPGVTLAGSTSRSTGAPAFIRKDLHFVPPPMLLPVKEGFANVEITATDGSGATKHLTLRIDLARKHGTFVDNFRLNDGFTTQNAYLALSLVDLADKTDAVRRTKLAAMGFDTDTAGFKVLGGEASNGFLVSNEDAVFVVFRGTNPSDVQSWAANIQITADPATRYARSAGARVHGGWKSQFEHDFENDIFNRLAQPRDNGKPIVVIGHSLGAAVATIAAARLNMAGKDVRAVYAFAGPSVGNLEFKNDYNSRLGQRHYRVTNQEDKIPRMTTPPSWWTVGRLWYIDHRTGHRLRQLEFDDLDVDMVAWCTLHCDATSFFSRHRYEEYWHYMAANLPSGVDRTALPPRTPVPSLPPLPQ